MILDTLEGAQRYLPLLPGLDQALAYLRINAKPSLAEGRHEIDGDAMFAVVSKYQTRDPGVVDPESHRKYVDVQFIISGREKILWTPTTEAAEVRVAYDEKRDIMFYGQNARSRGFELAAGHVAIFFPTDAHQPGCTLEASEPVHKAVVKVRLPQSASA
ncbi:MAG: YhcH/YjgK/YiaL family protein [Pirellulales bacterium]|nr:YhcH/YjgK/YiaL family protein [Pirellulales bacterium]